MDMDIERIDDICNALEVIALVAIHKTEMSDQARDDLENIMGKRIRGEGVQTRGYDREDQE